MWQAQRSWRQKYVAFNLWGTLYSSRALGLFPFNYNASANKLNRSRWQLGYGIILNGLLLYITCSHSSESQPHETEELFKRNSLAQQINIVQDFLLLLTVLVMYFRSWWLSQDLGQVLNVLLQLHKRHFEQHDTADCYQFDYYVVYKSSSIILEIASMFAIQFGLWPMRNFLRILVFFTTLILQFGVLLVGMHFHLAVLYIYRSVWIINRELLELLMHRERRKSKRIHQLHAIYGRLLEMNSKLAGLYDYQMIMLMITLLSVNITSIFYFLVFSISLKKANSIFAILNFSQALFINFVDFWMSIAVCELAERAGRGTSTILKLFNDLPNLDTKLERSLNDFALFCSHRRLKFNHCGLFHVHNAMGFRMLITSVLYILYLVQFDYMNF